MIELRALGSFEIEEVDPGGGSVPVHLSPTHAALLAYLVLARPRAFHTRDELVGVFWPEMPETRARASLSQALYRLKNAFTSSVLVRRPDGAVAADFAGIRCDAVAISDGLDGHAPEGALDGYAGELLKGFHLPDSGTFGFWLDDERRGLHARVVHAGRALADRLAQEGHLAAAAHRAGQALARSPCDATLARMLMELLVRMGDRLGAVRAYEGFARTLARELEMDPPADLRALVTQIRADDSMATRPAPIPQPESSVTPDPNADERPPPRGRWRRWRSALAGAAVAVSLLLVAALATPASRSPIPTAAASERIAILPFEVRGSDDLRYLSDGMAQLLSAKLDGVGPLRVVEPRAILNFLGAHADGEAPAPDPGEAVAHRFGVSSYVEGTVVEAGGRVTLRASLYRGDGTLEARVASAVGTESALFELVDEIAGKLVASRYGEPAERMSRLAALTTHSSRALKAYLAGERAFRRGRYDRAVRAFATAAVADSTFALAHYRLSLASLWADVPDTLPFDAEARALRHSHRLSQRDRALVEAYRRWRSGHADEAEQLYGTIVATYPEDAEAWTQLGDLRFHYNPVRGRSIGDARSAFERVLVLDPHNWSAQWHLALIAASERRWLHFDQLTQRLLTLDPGHDQDLEIRVLRTVAQRDSAALGALAPRLLRADDLLLYNVAWRAAVHLHEPAAAATIARLLTHEERSRTARATGHQVLSYLALARGRWRDAARELEALEAVDPEGRRAFELRVLAAAHPLLPPVWRREAALRDAAGRWRADGADYRLEKIYLTAMADLALRDTASALLRAATLERESRAIDVLDRYQGLIDGIRAAVIRHAGRPAEALHLLEGSTLDRWFGRAATSPVKARSWERFLAGELLRDLGRDSAALGWYASYGELGIADLLLLAPAHLRQADIHAGLGDMNAAARHYARFVDLWQDADPELQPTVRRARSWLRQHPGVTAAW